MWITLGQEFPKLNKFHKITFRTPKENNLTPSAIPESLENEVFKEKHNSIFLNLIHAFQGIDLSYNLFVCLINNFNLLAHRHCLNSLNLNLIILLNIFTDTSVCLPFSLMLNGSRSLVLGMQVT